MNCGSKADEARSVERAYSSPEIVQQRFRTLEALNVRPGERILDAGCGPGLLTVELARLAGEHGRVIAVDKSADMLARAENRCRGLPWVELKQASITRLEEPDRSFDAVVCTQVLLYVRDVAAVIAELHRVLKPGGRIVIVETDWRGCVLSSEHSDLTDDMIKAWDAGVPSPNLPPRLAPMLRAAGFSAVRIEPVPLLSTNLIPGGYSHDMIHWFARRAIERDRVNPADAERWLEDLRDKARRDEYFFCINRFLFSAVR